MPHTARHARAARRTAALLPGLLILGAASALGGLAVLPGPAAAESSTSAPVQVAAVSAPAPPTEQQDALELTWFSPLEARDPIVLAEFENGQSTLLLHALAHLGV